METNEGTKEEKKKIIVLGSQGRGAVKQTRVTIAQGTAERLIRTLLLSQNVRHGSSYR